MESIKNRTSIRKYADREVSEELLNSLLQEAERTPTMGNLQLYSVVITRSEEEKEGLGACSFQPTDGDTSTSSADHLRRLSPHHSMGKSS